MNFVSIDWLTKTGIINFDFDENLQKYYRFVDNLTKKSVIVNHSCLFTTFYSRFFF